MSFLVLFLCPFWHFILRFILDWFWGPRGPTFHTCSHPFSRSTLHTQLLPKWPPNGPFWRPSKGEKWLLGPLRDRFASKCRSRTHFCCSRTQFWWFIMIFGASELHFSQCSDHVWYDFGICFSYCFTPQRQHSTYRMKTMIYEKNIMWDGAL